MSTDILLEYVGGGKFQTYTKMSFDDVSEKFIAGEKIRASLTRRRSVRQNNLFHALVQAAFENQRGGMKLATWEHLKAHLLIRAGWCEEYHFKAGSMTKEVASVLRRKFEFVDFTVNKKTGGITMRFAKSVSFKDCPSDKMGEIVDSTIGIICTEIVPGSDPETILNEAKMRA